MTFEKRFNYKSFPLEKRRLCGRVVSQPLYIVGTNQEGRLLYAFTDGSSRPFKENDVKNLPDLISEYGESNIVIALEQ